METCGLINCRGRASTCRYLGRRDHGKIVHCKMIRQWKLLCLGLFLSLVNRSHQIHKFMTDDEVRQVFHTDRNSVPEYEVVRVLHSDPRDNAKQLKVHLKAFGDDVNLYLNPAEGTLFTEDTPVYTVSSNESDSGELDYKLVSGTEIEKNIVVWEDPKEMASIVAYQGKDGKIHFNGPYGDKFVIRTLPGRVMKLVGKSRKYNDPQSFPLHLGKNDLLRMSNHHIVVKYTVKEDTGRLENGRNEVITGHPGDRHHARFFDRSAPKGVPRVVYPEILVIVDYDAFKSHNFLLKETILYYAAFFNAVDLKYRALDKPKVRFHVAGIIIATDREATPYLNDKRINDDMIKSSALDAMCLYLYKEKKFPRASYDIAVTITTSKLQQCKDAEDPSTCVELRGISKFGTACDWDHETKRMESAALVHDEGFDGISTAAHEIAHIFGVPHDGSPSLAYVGGPGAQTCNWEDGYLMSSSRHNKNALVFSPCSQTCFRYFFGKPEARCIYNKPKSFNPLQRLLPGKMLSIDEQCMRATGGKACWHNKRVCTLLWCQVPGDDSDCVASAPAAEGSDCGDGKICILGRCMEEELDR